ncbi:MAG TPA: two-component regulator propeller domain-containing protein [Cellvibrionaceae bacterium]
MCIAARQGYAVAPSFEVILTDTSFGEIKAILQDKEGYMWFGGRNALLRYNAYKYQNIQLVERAGTQLKNVSPYYVTDIFQDSAGTLWVTSHSGLYYFDADREILMRPGPKDGQTDAYFLGPLQDIDELPSGDLIVGGDGAGLAIFDKKSMRIQWKQSDADEKMPSAMVADRTIQKIFVGANQSVWVANNKGLNLFDAATKSFSLFIPNPDNPASKVDNAFLTLAEDKAGNILGGTLGKGLYIFDIKTHTFRHYVNDPNNPNSLPDDTIWKILIDSDNKIWLSQARTGFSWFDEQTQTFTHFDYAYGQPGALAYGGTRSLYEDNNKNIWIGHFPAKVSFHDRSTSSIGIYRKDQDNPNAMSDNNVQRVMEDQQHNIWMSVGDGVNVLDRKNSKVKRYNEKLGNYPAHGSLSGYVDRNNSVWIGTWTEGFFKLNPATDRFEAMPFKAGLASAGEKNSTVLNDATIWGFCETRDNTFWIGTHYAGVSRYDVNTGVFTKYRNENTDTSLANNIVWTCYEDSKGRFWMGTANGLSVMDREKETFKSYKPSERNPHNLKAGSVEDIYEDASGRLWFSTSSGLHLYREASDDFEVFTIENGFDNNGIRALTGDHFGNLWLGTNNGIIQFNPDTHSVKNYLASGGKKFGGVNAGAALTSAAGEIVFGTNDGLVIIDVENITTNKLQPPVVLSDFKIFARSVSLNDTDSVLTKVINRSASVTLNHTQRMFSFEFSALNFRDAEKNHYAYKLEGFDQNWREIGTAREAQYTNLSPGEYVFNVRASNNDGVWTDLPKSITVIQLPPPWKTWWAFTLYTLLGVLSIAYVIYLQKRKQHLVEEQNRLLELKVSERTRDLADKNRDIQALLSNMRQGIFTVEEDGSIHQEYSLFLESIFETKSIAGRNVLDLLFTHAVLDGDKISQIQSSLNSIIGANEINYDLNSHLLLAEYQLALDSGDKIISLDWSPILNTDRNVVKIMVSVRDVTQLKALENEASIKKRELDIVAQLLCVSARAYSNFCESSARYIVDSKQIILNSTVFDEQVMGKIFRNMHTLKGNSRTFGFSYIANAAHQAESFYANVHCLLAEQCRDKLLEDLQTVAAIVAEYQHIYTNIVRANQGSVESGHGVWIDELVLNELQSSVESIKSAAPEIYLSLHTVINKISAASLTDLLAPLINSLPSLAVQAGKNAPAVAIHDKGILIKESAHDLLRDIFTHLFRNCIDHGIENAHTRLANNKEAQGTIFLDVEIKQTNLCIRLTDDGCGLNLHRLYQKRLDKGLLPENKKFTRLDVANSIFLHGMSTKNNVDTLSGRGIGMDAVRQFIIDFGGDVRIVLPEGQVIYADADDLESVAFTLQLILPKEKCVL